MAAAKLLETSLWLLLLLLVMRPHKHWSQKGPLESQEYWVHLQRLPVRLNLLPSRLPDGWLGPNLPLSEPEPVDLLLSSYYLPQLSLLGEQGLLLAVDNTF